MCGIIAQLGLQDAAAARPTVVRLARRLRHRGPDWSGVRVQGDAVLAHERLAIVHPESGAQPIVRGGVALTVNGEIYNHKELRAGLGLPEGGEVSDCEVVLDLYRARPSATAAECAAWLRELRSMHAFVLHDAGTGRFVVSRDHMGIVPLYWGAGRDGASVWFASELKALHDVCAEPRVFPPGHVLVHSGAGGAAAEPLAWYTPPHYAPGHAPSAPVDLAALRAALETAVRRRMMSDVPYAVLLSGGLDSSLVAALAAREAAPERIHTFSVGLRGSPDLAAARRVAAHIGSEHHEVTYTVQEGLDALHATVEHLETFDVTTIRAGCAMTLLARAVAARGFKMVLSGEGSDELLAGYLYFAKAPSPEALHAETVDKLRALHLYDCLRANKAMSAHGVEARVPFLDPDFIDAAMGFDPRDKMGRDADGAPRIEKWALRAAFDGADRLLPSEVLWRQKEQFSDGVGFEWIDTLKEAGGLVSDAQLAAAAARWPYATPATKEAYLYRQMFEECYPSEAAARTVVDTGATIACSTSAATKWDPSFQNALDPSGRAVVGVHKDPLKL